MSPAPDSGEHPAALAVTEAELTGSPDVGPATGTAGVGVGVGVGRTEHASDSAPPRRGLLAKLRRISVDTRPLRIPAYRRLLLGQMVTVIGTQMTVVAVQQQIFSITRSSAWVGAASFVALIPLITFGLLGGAIADTYDVITARDTYQEARPMAEAFAELRKSAGTQLDEDLVELFIATMLSRGVVFRHALADDFEAELALERRASASPRPRKQTAI